MSVTRTGRAAHIHAAASGGPRYNPDQTHAERSGIGNGIWLCAICADEVDGDEGRFPAAELVRWREEHEARLRREGGAPFLPEVRLTTLAGLKVPPVGSFSVDFKDMEPYRDQVLEVSNPWDYPLRDIDAVLQFPERVVGLVTQKAPPSAVMVFEPTSTLWTVMGTGGGSVTGNLPPGRSVRFGASALGPRRSLTLTFRTMLLLPRDEHLFRRPALGEDNEGACRYHIRGTLQVEVGGRWLDRRFAVPLQYAVDARRVTSHPCQSDGPGLRLLTVFELG